MTYRYIIFFISLLGIHFACESKPVVKTGLDRIEEYQHLFTGKRVGIITNHTGYNQQNQFISDIIQNLPNTTVKALFGPEHGIKGKEEAGKKVNDDIESQPMIPVYSLYGKTLKPTADMLKNIEILVFDIQDIGARFYTYIYTMSLAMEAAAENNIPFVVLDRPNPITGVHTEGNILEDEFKTFVGLHPIAVRHGMTVGELAIMFNNEGWLKDNIKADLKVIPMENWERQMWFDQTGLLWRSPSPNMPSLDVATVYPGTCLFEGTNISEGRGTYQPFLLIGAPWFIMDNFVAVNKVIEQPGVKFGPVSFTPKSIPGMSENPKHKDNSANGLSLTVTDREKFRPYLTGIMLVQYLYRLNMKSFQWRESHFDRLCGTSKIRKFIIEGKELNEIKEWMDNDIKSFLNIRRNYLLY